MLSCPNSWRLFALRGSTGCPVNPLRLAPQAYVNHAFA